MERTTPVVVYVDGYRGNRVVFQANFQSSFEVVCAASADIVVPLLSADLVAMLLVDPEWEAFLELLNRTRVRFSHVPCGVVTASDSLVDQITGIDETIDAFMKPWSREDILAKAHAAIAQWHCRQPRMAATG